MKIENAIENYDSLYAGYKYLEDTENKNQRYKHQLSDFVETFDIRSRERNKLLKEGKTEEANEWIRDEEIEEQEKVHSLFPKLQEDKEDYEMYKKSLLAEPTPFHQYKNKVNELKNLRIGSFMVDRTHNKELQRYMETNDAQLEDNPHEMLEAEEQTEIVAFEEEDNQVGLHQAAEAEETKRQRLSREIEEYKENLVDQIRAQDMFRRKNLGKKAEFKHMTLIENLNFVKYNSEDIKKNFEIFKSASSVIQTPSLAAGIIQQMSKSKELLVDTDKRNLAITRPEYRTMLKQINNKAALLDDKNLVDTLYCIGKIHKTEKELVNLPKTLNKYLDEISSR